MTARRSRFAALLLPLVVAACAGPRAIDRSAAPPVDSPAEQARREERLKLMQRYWQERTGATPAGDGHATWPAPDGPLTYPAGTYDGLRFAPRVTDEPGLGEPVR
jgi:hypothetical protein